MKKMKNQISETLRMLDQDKITDKHPFKKPCQRKK